MAKQHCFSILKQEKANNCSRKAQIKLFESVGVLVIFAFLLVFGVNLYFTLANAGVQRDYERALSMRVFGMAQRSAFMPELECSFGGIGDVACIDWKKAEALAGIALASATKELYFPVFGWSKVTLKRIFPPDDPLTLYDNILPGWTRKKMERLPMLLYNPSEGKRYFGMIEVEFYAK